jgi:hypothetical protein
MFAYLATMRSEFEGFRDSLAAFQSIALERRLLAWYTFLFQIGEAVQASELNYEAAVLAGPITGTLSADADWTRMVFGNEMNYAQQEGAALVEWMNDPTKAPPPLTPLVTSGAR